MIVRMPGHTLSKFWPPLVLVSAYGRALPSSPTSTGEDKKLLNLDRRTPTFVWALDLGGTICKVLFQVHLKFGRKNDLKKYFSSVVVNQLRKLEQGPR